ncbi:hypothetical protein N9Y92_00980 [Chlamydiales bacterium]|nr:hypothetical protein [Chlamydiales bacterium]
MIKNIYLLLVFIGVLSADIPPADISIFMLEIKYNEKQGVKICEIQPASLSMFGGFDHVYEKNGLIGKNISTLLSQFGNSFWVVKSDIVFNPLSNCLIKEG